MTPPAEIRSGPWPPGWHVTEVAETGSTNADLLAAAADGAPDRTVLRADHQTAGRGRLDRRWDAPPGSNLLVSILRREVPDDPGLVTRAAGVALVRVVRAVTGAEVELKWPNDVLLDGRKLAGILAQRAPDGAVVVGIGCNVGWAPDGAARLADMPSRGGAGPICVGDLLAALLGELDVVEALDPDALHVEHRALLGTLGRRVRVELPGGDVLEGRAVDVAVDGRLAVLDPCGVTHRLDVGDVVHLRSASP